MNIFPIHKNPRICAMWMCDQHIIKILTEAVEIYSSIIYKINPNLWNKIPQQHKYKPVTSPWVKWGCNKINRIWLIFYIYELNKEYKYRFGQHKTHKAYHIFLHLIKIMREIPNVDISLKYPKHYLQIVSLNCKCELDIIAYRKYYKQKYTTTFKIPMRWTKRERPQFLN